MEGAGKMGKGGGREWGKKGFREWGKGEEAVNQTLAFSGLACTVQLLLGQSVMT
jgi:hypothetical protein